MLIRKFSGVRRAVPHQIVLLCLVLIVQVVITPAAFAQLELQCPDAVLSDGTEIEPTPQYYVGVGNAYFQQIDYTNAIAAYSCALELSPDYAPAYVRRGYAYTVQGDDVRALDDFNRALELDDTLIEAYNNRGVLYMSQGNFGFAIGDFTLVIAFEPDNAVAYNNRGIAYAAEGSFDLAVADLQMAIQLDPDYPAPHASLGATYTALAVQSYNDYRFMSGQGEFVLPRRQPIEVIRAVDEDGVIRDFQVWIPFLTPSIE